VTSTEIDVEPRPYGIKVDSKGTVWVAFNGTNKIGALDPRYHGHTLLRSAR
jgi:streptogramin lyase